MNTAPDEYKNLRLNFATTGKQKGMVKQITPKCSGRFQHYKTQRVPIIASPLHTVRNATMKYTATLH